MEGAAAEGAFEQVFRDPHVFRGSVALGYDECAVQLFGLLGAVDEVRIALAYAQGAVVRGGH